jgi:hypothetical protein
VSDDDLKECSQLFSQHYGVWGSQMNEKYQKRVSLSANMMRSQYLFSNDCALVVAKSNHKIIGQAFFIRFWNDKLNGWVVWITQLVVHSQFRRLGIGKGLCNSSWNPSTDIAVGLVSANPFAVKALESATSSHVTEKTVRQYADTLMDTCSIPYMKNCKMNKAFSNNEPNCSINTAFHVDHTEINADLLKLEKDGKWTLGKLKDGHEFFAFVFKDSKVKQEKEKEDARLLLDFIQNEKSKIVISYDMQEKMSDFARNHFNNKDLDEYFTFVFGKMSLSRANLKNPYNRFYPEMKCPELVAWFQSYLEHILQTTSTTLEILNQKKQQFQNVAKTIQVKRMTRLQPILKLLQMTEMKFDPLMEHNRHQPDKQCFTCMIEMMENFWEEFFGQNSQVVITTNNDKNGNNGNNKIKIKTLTQMVNSDLNDDDDDEQDMFSAILKSQVFSTRDFNRLKRNLDEVKHVEFAIETWSNTKNDNNQIPNIVVCKVPCCLFDSIVSFLIEVGY